MKVIAIGRNYSEHAKELGNLVPEKTVFFMKPETAILKDNKPFYYPNFTKDLHYETEIVFQICKVGKNIEKQFANRYYDKIGIGIDFTARDLQRESKEKGLPWEHAKSFDNSAVISQLVDKEEFTDVNAVNFSMTLNGNTMQIGNTKDMINSIDEIIAFVSEYVTLKIGDLIYTGTPKGVGAVKIGDKIEAFIENKKMLECEIK
jgi:2-keto-4-pentenoate hydratase/2-oxohepta-3-ene-1,7-dioic acid hydratase in catechol pathway